MEDKKLKRKEILRAVKFGLFSISAGVIELGSFALLDLIPGLSYWPKYLTALILSVLWNFTLNRKFTFKSANNVPIAMLKVAAYYCVFTPVTTILGNYLVETLGWPGIPVTIMNMALNLTTEFIYDKYVVFRNSIDSNALAQREKEKAQ